VKCVVSQQELNCLSYIVGLVFNQQAVDSVLNGFSYSAFRNSYDREPAGIGFEWSVSEWL
jgi:hypothetical protein